MTAPVVTAQGSRALWWDPRRHFDVPLGASAIEWDVLSSVVDSKSAFALGESLVAGARRMYGQTYDDVEMPGRYPSRFGSSSGERIAVVIGAILLATRFTEDSAPCAAAWIDEGPRAWKRAVHVLDGSADSGAWVLAGELDVCIRTLDRWFDQAAGMDLVVVAGALTSTASAGDTPSRIYLRRFLSEGTDVLFVPVPVPDRSPMSIAAGLFVQRIVRLTETMQAIAPVSIVMDGTGRSDFPAELAQSLGRIRSGAVVRLAALRRPASSCGRRRARLRGSTGANGGWGATLQFLDDDLPDTAWLTTVRGARTRVYVPGFDQVPWFEMRSRALDLLGGDDVPGVDDIPRSATHQATA